MKRKILAALVAVCLLATAFSLIACNKDEGEDKNITVIVPDGAPSVAIAKLLSENKQFDGYNVTYKIEAGTTNLQAAILNGEADIALCPTNMAAILYNKGTDIKLLGSNVYGLLYLVGSSELSSLSELKGKVVFSLGKGNTPEFVLKYVLQKNGVEYEESDEAIEGKVAIRYATEAQTLIQQMVAGTASYAVLGEPQATQATKKAEGFKVLYDLQELWGGGYPQVSTVAKSSLISEHAAFIDAFMAELTANTEYVKTSAEGVQTALTAFGSKITGLNEGIISRCNVKFTAAAEAKDDINSYLTVMTGFKAQFTGGKLPDDNFYYIK